MKFKTEVSLLVLAIVLFAVSMFFYSYPSAIAKTASLSSNLAFPYQGVALAFVGIGSISMLVASISYQKKTKSILN
jgi:hypothetical protein